MSGHAANPFRATRHPPDRGGRATVLDRVPMP